MDGWWVIYSGVQEAAAGPHRGMGSGKAQQQKRIQKRIHNIRSGLPVRAAS
jgi:hypothetical protein